MADKLKVLGAYFKANAMPLVIGAAIGVSLGLLLF